jgi:HSP20 family protein
MIGDGVRQRGGYQKEVHIMLTPTNALTGLRREVDRLFEDYFGDGGSFLSARRYPPVNAWEDDEHLYVEAEIPGIAMKDLEVYVRDNQLTIKGTRPEGEIGEGVCYRQERPTGDFSRTLDLPVEVDASNVDAKLEHGVLTVTMAKSRNAVAKRIPIRSE